MFSSRLMRASSNRAMACRRSFVSRIARLYTFSLMKLNFSGSSWIVGIGLLLGLLFDFRPVTLLTASRSWPHSATASRLTNLRSYFSPRSVVSISSIVRAGMIESQTTTSPLSRE
uniref:(northern house mosquito) hypothetical protein n=1 Tax=Culex pipiens TaxID=7175 RepID=A0A8D8BPZ2_CULPI